MKIEQQHIDLIRYKFAAMQTKDDLVALLNIAKKIQYGEESNPICLKSLTYYADPKLAKDRYVEFSVKKKTGGVRKINAPVVGLKSILRALNLVLQCIYEPHQAANGFICDKSIVDNAKAHVGSKYVYNLDLKDFFHSFDRKMVRYGFYCAPFNLNDEKREPLAFLLACLCTHTLEIDGETKLVLPQGSPTSPTITNVLCKKLDKRLTGFAKRFGAKYTRYADDITFSSQLNVFKNEEFLNELTRIIETDQLLKINPSKTRMQNAYNQQEVTGLIVNEKVNVRQRYLKQIRMWIYYWEKYGYEKAQSIFLRDYKAEKGHVKKGKPNLDNVLDGKLEFLKMVKGDKDSTYVKLRERFDKLSDQKDPINEILDIWENEGIETAMQKYYQTDEDNKDLKVEFML